MKKPHRPEFDPQLLASIDPERREEFKIAVRKNRYLGSGLFFFIWHANIFYLSLPVVWFIHQLIPPYHRLMIHLFSYYSFVLEGFFLMVVVGLLARRLKENLNQKGIHASHVLFVSLPLLYLLILWVELSPERGY